MQRIITPAERVAAAGIVPPAPRSGSAAGRVLRHRARLHAARAGFAGSLRRCLMGVC